MSAGLISHLKAKAEEDKNIAILLAQWEFDEKLVGKALENISSYYPHFSSHNASHSHQILVNIERLLDKNIIELSATDTWLLLESAYWHDVGMLFNSQQVQDIIKDSKFNEYVEILANDNSQDLHEFAKKWHKDGWQQAIIMDDHPHKGVEKYRQMVAEWYRRGHPKNSQRIVEDPFEILGINSPRTELLPKRIYRYLGQICLAHGDSFDSVMSQLPYRQTGMGTENCHPRFVACMLRLGDLFDIDDNRFCPVMMKQTTMPKLSEAHHRKHLAIREFQLDNKTVSITAECADEDAYIQTQSWFGWIKEEMQNQMSQWKNIVPNRTFGLLPTIQKLDVEMTTSKILLNNKPMKFGLDEKSAIELLQGKNLYDDETNIYRELIQNAVDATYLRVWIEHGMRKKDITDDFHPFHKDFQEILEDYPISIDFVKLEDEADSDLSIWQFSLTDKGTGISLKDLEYMQKIAGSSRNVEKKRLMKDMPIWMKPSGAFGIGLHSAFLLLENGRPEDNKIVLETKSIVDNASYRIEMTSPISGNQGYCFIEKLSAEENLNRDYGTKLILALKVARRGRRYNSLFDNDDERKLIDIYQKQYDAIKKPIFDYLNMIFIQSNIKKEILPLVACKIFLGKIEFKKNLKDLDILWDNKFNLFFKFYNLENVSYLMNLPSHTFTYFKGQEVDSISLGLNVRCLLDFYEFNAREALQLDRNKWRKEFLNKLNHEEYFITLFKYLFENYFSEISEQINNPQAVQAILSEINPNSDFYNESWKDMQYFDERNTKFSSDLENVKSYNDLLSLSEFNIIEDRDYEHKKFKAFDSNNEKLTIITKGTNSNSVTHTFEEEWYKNGGLVKEHKDDNNSSSKFSKINSENNYIILLMQDAMDYRETRITLSNESVHEAGLQKFKKLLCLSESHFNFAGKDNKNFSKPFLILPFCIFSDEHNKKFINTNNLDFLIESVYNSIHAENNAIDKSEIEKLYCELTEYIDEKMQVIPKWVEARERGEKFTPKDVQELEDSFKLPSIS